MRRCWVMASASRNVSSPIFRAMPRLVTIAARSRSVAALAIAVSTAAIAWDARSADRQIRLYRWLPKKRPWDSKLTQTNARRRALVQICAICSHDSADDAPRWAGPLSRRSGDTAKISIDGRSNSAGPKRAIHGEVPSARASGHVIGVKGCPGRAERMRGIRRASLAPRTHRAISPCRRPPPLQASLSTH
jgi:hypothetical protein